MSTIDVSLVVADLASAIQTYSDLAIQLFSLHNTQLNPTGSSNAQIYAVSIEITYTAD